MPIDGRTTRGWCHVMDGNKIMCNFNSLNQNAAGV